MSTPHSRSDASRTSGYPSMRRFASTASGRLEQIHDAGSMSWEPSSPPARIVIELTIMLGLAATHRPSSMCMMTRNGEAPVRAAV